MNAFRDARVLVTGGAGFVGSNLVGELLEAGVAAVEVVDNLLSSEPENLPADPRVQLTRGSAADEGVLASLTDRFDYAFHLATFHGNQNSIADPLADHANNLLPTLRLFEAVKGFKKLRAVVYSGAGCAVAEKTFGPAQATAEDAPVSLAMDSPYSISKIVGEFYGVYYHARCGLPVVRARFQNVYGPGEVLGAGAWRGTAATVWRNVIPTFVYKALRGEPLPVEGTGQASRDFVFVHDIVRGLMLCAQRGRPGEVYNLASGVEVRIGDLAALINELARNPAPIDVRPARDWDHSGCRFGSTVKAREALGFQARVGLREGLEKTIDWTRRNLPRIEACIRRHGDRPGALRG